MPKIDLSVLPLRRGSDYPPPFDVPCAGRARQRLGEAGGLSAFGVNLLHLPPGGWSSQRHWHSHEDEFVMVVSGELVLVTDEGETLRHACGDGDRAPVGQSSVHARANRLFCVQFSQ